MCGALLTSISPLIQLLDATPQCILPQVRRSNISHRCFWGDLARKQPVAKTAVSELKAACALNVVFL
jgi:hypothetical protein